ncbi:L,D-transpeptidase [Limosilactobacillus sp.]|uniref:L,D-transpeptidase n=1 Tax=Limosilactobacillus sp. TaxID=2773925 RepID=UPI003F08A677
MDKLIKVVTVMLIIVGSLILTPAGHASHMRTPIDWQQSSETIAYPDLQKTPNLWIKVRLKHNRTYVYSGQKCIYTMYSSAGKLQKDPTSHTTKSVTPTGTYTIHGARGDWVYNPNLKLGANYYVAWNGNYLFHTVVTDPNHHYIKGEAQKLGKKPSSPGCVCLSVPDAKWLAGSVPEGTKVVVTN